MQNIVQIQLIGNNEGYLDLGENTNFPLNFGISDVRDLTKRKGTTSKTVKLAGSKNNNKLLNNYFDVNVIAGTFNINTLQKCAVIENGITILDDVYIQLTKVVKEQSNGQHDQLVSYECVIKDSTSDFFTVIGNNELTDLVMQSLETYHQYSTSEVVSSWSHTWEDVYKYVMPVNSLTNEYALNEWMPGIYAKAYWNKIFEAAGYRYEWDAHTGTTQQFDKLIIPYNGDQSKLTDENLAQIEVLADSNSVNQDIAGPVPTVGLNANIPFTKINVTNETKDLEDYYIASSSTYNSPITAINPNAIQYEIDVEWEMVMRNSGAVNVTSSQGQFSYQPRIAVKNMANGTVSTKPLIYDYKNPSYLLVGYSDSSGVVIPNGSSNIWVPGDTVAMSGTNTIAIDSTTVFGGSDLQLGLYMNIPQNGGVWRKYDSFDVGYMNPVMKIKNISIRIVPNFEVLTYSSPVFLNSFVPKKVKQSDFIKAFVTLYNLYIEVDPFDSNKLIIKSRDEYYDAGAEVNWTKKLNKEKEQELQFLPELNKKKLKLTYKADDKDAALVAYTQATDDVYGEVEFTFDNEYTKDEEKKEIVFSPTIITDTIFGAVCPNIPGVSPKNNIRLLYDGGMFDCNDWYIYDYSTVGTSGMTQYPLFSHMNDPYNPSFDINFGQCGYYSVLGLELTNNNMYNLHWRRTLNQMNTSKMMTAYFDLKASDIQKMKLSDKIRIDNSWWNINKIQDYNPTKEGPTKVELLSIDDELKMVPFKVWKPPTKPVVFPPGPVIEPVGPVKPTRPVIGGWAHIDWILKDTTKKRDVFTNDMSGISSLIDGRNNIIGEDSTKGIIIGDGNSVYNDAIVFGSGNTIEVNAENSLVFGDDNYVQDGTEKSFIVGDGITADTSNTMYASNVNIVNSLTIQSGATFNLSGVTITGLDYLPLSGGTMTGDITLSAGTKILSTESTAAIQMDVDWDGDPSIVVGDPTNGRLQVADSARLISGDGAYLLLTDTADINSDLYLTRDSGTTPLSINTRSNIGLSIGNVSSTGPITIGHPTANGVLITSTGLTVNSTLKINSIPSGTPVGNLGYDSTGNVVIGTTGGGGLSSGDIIFISSASDFPAAVGGVITLLPNITYFITSDIDLLGDRLVGASNTTLIGGSSENCTITSTGLGVGVALFTTEWTTPIRHIAFVDVDTAIDINGVTNAPLALDWTGVNFLNVPNIGVIDTCDNFIFSKGAFLNSQGLLFTGTIGTVGLDNSIFVGTGAAGNQMELDASCIITRRFRIIYSSFVNFGSTVAINVNTGATIPTEAYILDTINFAGGGTYLSGVTQTSNDSLFKSCVGITNTAVNGQLYMQGNVTATVIPDTTNFVKVSGTTTASVDNSKFSHSNNRLTCDAVISRKYLIQCSLSFNAGNNNVCEFGFYDSQLGVVRTPSKTKTTANPAGRAENITFFCVVSMDNADYIEIHARNTSSATNITVDQMNFTITEIL